MTRYFLLLNLVLALAHAQDPTHSPGNAASSRPTLSPSEYLRQKEDQYRRQDEELKIHESALEFWSKELVNAKANANTAGLVGHANLIMIPVTYYYGGKLLKWVAPAAPAKKFFSLTKAREYLIKYPKFAGTVAITAEAGAAAGGTYYYWVLSPEEIKELTIKVEEAKAETDKARLKLNKVLVDLNGKAPERTPNSSNTPDKLDEK